MEHINVAVIGIGNMGSAHASCIAENKIKGMSLTAVCDISEKKLASFSQKHPDIKCFKSYKELFDAKICDSVIIAVPHPLHSEIAIKAFEHGLNVMLEKPADIAVSRVKKLNETAQKSGKVFAIMFNQRTNGLFEKAREIVKSGKLGELKRSVWIITNWFRTQSYYNSGNWRATWAGEGGGVLLNQAPHNLDLWQWICGMPKSITAFCDVAKYHSIEVEDDVTIFARYENGATGTFMTSTGEYPGTNRLEISGELGKIVLEKGTLKWYKLNQPVSEIIATYENGTAPVQECEIDCSKQSTVPQGHMGILQNFTNAVLYGEKLISPGTDGINELTISNAAYLSQWLGNREITLPLDDEVFDRELAKRAENSKYVACDSGEGVNNSYLPKWQTKW